MIGNEFTSTNCRGKQGYNLSFWFHSNARPLNCRGGCYFCLDTKVTKKSSHQIGFFAAEGLCAQSRKNLGCNLFAGLPYRFITLHAKSCEALPALLATIVFPAFSRSLSADEGHHCKLKNLHIRISAHRPLSPEAYLLTRVIIVN